MVEIDKSEFGAKFFEIQVSSGMLSFDPKKKLNLILRKIEVGRTSPFGGRVTSDRVDRVVVIDKRCLVHFNILFKTRSSI